MKSIVNIYRRVTVWEKEVHEIEGDSKETIIAKAIEIGKDPYYPSMVTLLDSEMLLDTVKYGIDASDVDDIAYEVAVNGEMVDGGGNFADPELRRIVSKAK